METIIKTWKDFHESKDVCNLLGVDFFEIASSICYYLGIFRRILAQLISVLDPKHSANNVAKINVIRFLKYAEISPAFATKMLRALIDHQKAN